MKKFRPFLIYLTLLLIAIVSFINIWFTFHALSETNRNNQDLFSQLTGRATTNAQKIKESEELINDIAIRVTEIQNSQQVSDPPKDGVDGAKGDKGDSVKGDKGDTGSKGDKGDSIKGDTGATGANGLTPEFRCNVSKNRWEVRYSQELGWEVLNGTPVKCTVTNEDIIRALLNH